jgi:hypothetical protein
MATSFMTAELTSTESPAKTRGLHWVWRQVWRDLLFLHWRVAAADLRPHVPAALAIETRAGHAWVSLVLFRLQVAPVGMPLVPGFSSLVEVNLRTYVELADQPGICFLSIHADNLAALTLARTLAPLPYRWANIRYRPGRKGCECELRRAASPACEMSLRAAFNSSTEWPGDAARQSWLLERYQAFAPARGSTSELQTAVVEHEPWVVQPVQVEQRHNSLGREFGLDLARPPDAAHCCREMHARFSRFVPCEGSLASFASAPATATIPDE